MAKQKIKKRHGRFDECRIRIKPWYAFPDFVCPIPSEIKSSKCHYFIIRVFKNKKDMYKAQDRWMKKHKASNRVEHSYEGCVCSCFKYKNNKIIGPVAVMFLHVKAAGAEVISHEATHIAMAYMRALMGPNKKDRRVRILYGKTEERIAYLVSFVCKIINTELKKAGKQIRWLR